MGYGTTAFISPGSGELILIMLALILLFGAKDAPRILRSIQSILDKIQRTAADFRYQIMYGDLGSGGGNTPSSDGDEPDFEQDEDEDEDWIDMEEDEPPAERRSDEDTGESDPTAEKKAESDSGKTDEQGAGV